MINPKDIQGKKFEKSAFGYKAEEVDSYLKDIAISYATMMKENDDCEGKILKLIDKVNEYREDEDALKEALLGAQKQGNRVLADAKSEAERIIREASEKAEKLLKDATANSERLIIVTKQQYDTDKNKLAILQKEVSNFKSSLSELYNKQLRLIMEIPEVDDDDEPQQAEIKHEETAVHQEATQEKPQATGAPYPNNNFKPNESRFGELKFGQNQNK